MEVYMAGKIGIDGDFLLELLRSYGVRTGHILRWEGATGQAIIQVDKTGQNSIVLYGGGNGALQKDEVGPILSAFGPGDMILLQNEIPLTAELMRAASARGMQVCLNPSPFDGRIGDLPLDLADLLFVNEIEGAGLAGRPVSEDPRAILEALALRFPRTELVLTAGKEGAYYAHGELRARGDIVDLPVADTTGAGDTFTGFYLAARQRGCGVAESLRLACKASSIAVSRKGAMAAMPFACEVF
jgi:ribokinase